MKTIKTVLFILLCCLVNSCNQQCNKDIKQIVPPPVIELEGTAIGFDTIEGVIGVVRHINRRYYCYMYKSPYCIMSMDEDYKNPSFYARKGEGPNDIYGMSTIYGEILQDSEIGIFDPYTAKIYQVIESNPDSIKLICDLQKKLAIYVPMDVFCIDKVNYLFVPGTYEYGLMSYVTTTDSIVRWPMGYDFGDLENPNQYITSFRALDYNRKNNVIAEIYGGLPVIILHDVTGKVINRVSFGIIPKIKEITAKTINKVADIRLTDSYIYILYREDDADNRDEIFVLNYDLEAVYRFHIDEAYTIEIDTANKRLICVNPEREDANLMTYDLSHYLTNP